MNSAENIIYYTFSTLPQILIAAAALLAVYSVFKLPKYTQSIIGWSKAVKIEMDRGNNKEKLAEHGKYAYSRLEKAIAKNSDKEAIEQIKEVKKCFETDSMVRVVNHLTGVYNSKLSLVQDSKRVISLSLILSVLFIVPLVFSDNFSLFYAKFFALGGVIVCLIAIIQIAEIISRTLDDDTELFSNVNPIETQEDKSAS